MPKEKNVHIADRRGHREYCEPPLQLDIRFMTDTNKGLSFASTENDFGLDFAQSEVKSVTHNTDFIDIAFPEATSNVPNFSFVQPGVLAGLAQSIATSPHAIKFDQGKPDLSLIPPELIEALGQVLSFGAKKYAARNWEKGMDYSRVYAALNRHLWAWWDPTKPDKDSETGLSHLAHAACCIAFLLSFEARGYTDFDDRPADKDGCRAE